MINYPLSGYHKKVSTRFLSTSVTMSRQILGDCDLSFEVFSYNSSWINLPVCHVCTVINLPFGLACLLFPCFFDPLAIFLKLFSQICSKEWPWNNNALQQRERERIKLLWTLVQVEYILNNPFQLSCLATRRKGSCQAASNLKVISKPRTN